MCRPRSPCALFAAPRADRYRKFILPSRCIVHPAGMRRPAVLVAAIAAIAAGAAHTAYADDAAPITLEQTLAAVGKAPAAQIGVHDIAAAEASAAAASAWPNPSLHV